MKRSIVVVFLLAGCSSGPRQRSVERSPGRPAALEETEQGRYDKPLALVTYETMDNHLGPGTRLSDDEQEVFWGTIRGHDVVWTGTITEIGERRPLAVPVRLRVGRQSGDWDTIVFFSPDFADRLRWYKPGDVITFRGSLERYEKTTEGIQVTVVKGRFAKPETG